MGKKDRGGGKDKRNLPDGNQESVLGTGFLDLFRTKRSPSVARRRQRNAASDNGPTDVISKGSGFGGRFAATRTTWLSLRPARSNPTGSRSRRAGRTSGAAACRDVRGPVTLRKAWGEVHRTREKVSERGQAGRCRTRHGAAAQPLTNRTDRFQRRARRRDACASATVSRMVAFRAFDCASGTR